MLERSEFKPYFDIHHGKKVWASEMPYVVKSAISVLLQSGEAVGQYGLPGIRPEGDMLIWMPGRVKERERVKEIQLIRIREELSRI